MNLIDFQQGDLANRRPAGVGNRFYRATNVDVCYFDDGFVWFPLVGGTLSEVTATESIPPYSAVTAYGTQADSNNPADQYKIIGVTVIAIPSGTTASLLTVGQIQNGAWNWTVGDVIYLNGVNFSNTQPGTGFLQQIGVALSPTVIQLGLYAQVVPGAPAVGFDVDTILVDSTGGVMTDTNGNVLVET